MPKAKANKVYSTFIKGMITEAGPLSFPENASTDELNCDLFIDGSRKRRRGFNLESSAVLSTPTVALATWDDYAISTHVWDTVGGDGNKNFLVVQIGPTVYFYDMSDTPLSSGAESFTINLNTYAAPSATEIEKYTIKADSGKGFLFIVGSKIKSLLVEYNSGSNTITVTEIIIKVRDFEGVNDTYAPDEEPATLTALHEYNLKNQGWLPPNSGGTNPITTYFTAAAKYPPNSKQWWQAKDSSEDFNATFMQKYVGGNTSAPKGHYILQAFYEDRSSVSGVAGITVESTSGRPTAITFFAGRAWYAGISGTGFSGNVYFSQILENNAINAGYCYQQNDPTSEDLSDLLATDGGVIPIPEMGSVLALFSMQSAVIIFANNGIWSISGGASGFKATDFIISKISSAGITAKNSVVDVDGVPVWWGNTGVHTLTQNDVNEKFQLQNLSQTTIQTFYDDIPPLSKTDAVGTYDASTKKIYWLYRETAPTSQLNRYRFNRALLLDIRLGAFYPWKLSTFSSTPYYIGSVFSMPLLFDLEEAKEVIDSANDVKDSANNVQSTEPVPSGSDIFVNFFVFKEGSSVVQWTFGNFINSSFYDWYNVDSIGVEFSSFFETGNELMQDIQREKVAVYVQCYFNKTETTYTDTSYTAWINPSGCYMQSKWEWSDHTNSGKYSPRVQAYRFVKSYTPSSGTDFNNGFPVVVTKNKIRGTGKSLRIRFESESGKDFDFLGWAIAFSGNTDV